jgi:uncharacterized membrane protein
MPMTSLFAHIHAGLVVLQYTVSVIGILIIMTGVLIAATQYIIFMMKGELVKHGAKINVIRLNLGRILILGLEFIVAADLIGTTTAPDYYSVGLAAIIVLIRTMLNYSINRELIEISKER